MGLFDTTQLGLEQALAGAQLRQRALANNIANANTPGFKRSDVDFQSSLKSALQAPDANRRLHSLAFEAKVDGSSSMRADGNNVDIDAEMAMLTQNSLQYQSLVAVARARHQMLQVAMGTRTA